MLVERDMCNEFSRHWHHLMKQDYEIVSTAKLNRKRWKTNDDHSSWDNTVSSWNMAWLRNYGEKESLILRLSCNKLMDPETLNLLETKLKSARASSRFLITDCNICDFFTLFDKLGLFDHITPLDNRVFQSRFRFFIEYIQNERLWKSWNVLK